MVFVLILVGFVPSLLWLHFYLRKDPHPEPRKLLLEVFFFGILLAPLAVAAQWLFGYIVGALAPGFAVGESSSFFIWSAFVEEIVKFLAVYYLIVHNREFDEPVDAMIYMITAALGFAAIENVLVLIKNMGSDPEGCFLGVSTVWCILGFRAVGATLLHALASGIAGYFLALAWFYRRHEKKFIWFGIFLATAAHFVFNTLLLSFGPLGGLLSSNIALVAMLLLVSILFHKVLARSPSRIMV